MSLIENIKSIRSSIVAIGYQLEPNKINITGSGFCVSDDGKILTVAHVYNQTPSQFQSKIVGMAMTEVQPNDLENYAWFPLTFLQKEDKNDLAMFQMPDFKKTLLKPMELGDSDTAEVGHEVYFLGFPYAAQLMNEGLGTTLVLNKAIISNIKQDGVDPNHPRNYLIIDAISNPGNSGCPLIDTETNKVLGVMNIAFRTKSQVPKYIDLDIREPMHIAAAKPINLVRNLL